ncbi:MAG: TolC family protein, partial [Bacteroidales bacterium]|nr:TolC family protein [Bacteroidales bacterium]
MRSRFIAFLIVTSLAACMSVTAQETPASLSLSVNEALDYAVENNRSVSSARYDLLASEKGVWEAMAAGLPSIDASSTLGYNLAIMTRIIDFNGVQTALKFGTLYDLSYGVSASTILFNAPWMVGVQTAKLATTLASQGLKQTEIETRESVMTAYYLILISEESLKVIDANLANLNEILSSTRAMFSVGMAEATDVDQMQATVTMLENTKASMERSLEVSYNMLRFLLGVGRGTELMLTESLDAVIEGVNVASLLAEEFNLQENITYSLIESQTKMSELSLKGAKATVLPSLGASIYYNRNGMGDKLNDLQFFPNSMLGFHLQVPIFGSGVRYSKIKKAQINLEKAQNNREMVTDQLLMQEKQLRYNLLSASEQYKSQKDNIEIAERVLKSFQNKYDQGMAS